ncbi:MAG: ferritin-like domain-containing protein [Myxococcales bacterium]|nr:ferritin-like domain-containing protein [Myxococcales bacterium]
MAIPLPVQHPQTDATHAAMDAVYNWNYEPEIDELRTLYANALDRQWIAMRDLDWEQGVDKEKFQQTFSLAGFPIQETRFWKELDPDTRWEVSRRTAAFMLSNFLHGEQGALMVASQLVNAVPHMDGKFYASTQTLDEARHVEVFAAFIKELDHIYPIMPSLKQILDQTLGHEDWLHKAVGMNIVVEGLALFTFRDMRNTTSEPLLKQLLTYVSRDEARHTGFGVKYLSHVLGEVDDRKKAELEDFAYEAARLLIDSRAGTTMRQSALEIWREAGLDPEEAFQRILKERQVVERMIGRQGGISGPVRGFVIPTLRRIGLFSERIEGHFRDMFEANLGKERAAGLDFDIQFPESLEDWIEATG